MGSRDLLRGPKGVGGPNQRSGWTARRSARGGEALPVGRVVLGVTTEGPEGVWSPSRIAGRGRESHPKGRERSGGPPVGPGRVERPSHRSMRGWESCTTSGRG